MSDPQRTSAQSVAASLRAFRRGLVVLFCQLSLFLSLLTTVVNILLGFFNVLLWVSILCVVAFGLLWLWLRRDPNTGDGPATVLVIFASAVVALGWMQFGGLLGSSPALLAPLAGMSLLFTTRRRQWMALVGTVLFGGTLIAIHLMWPSWIDPFYATESEQLWDVASAQIIGMLMVGALFLRLASHHIQGWEELARQQAANMELLRTTAAQAEEDLRSRLEVTRRMGDGIAHDLNNVLMVVRLSAESIEAPEEADVRETIVESATTATRLVQRFRRDRAEEVESLELDVLLRSLQRSVACLAPDVTLGLSIDVPNPVMRATRAEFEQVMMNLCLNSLQAMEPTGHLTIKVCGLPTGGLEIAVRDTGRGIPKVDLENIFEPFFTTRMKQGGTGIGLANVRRIVERWGGELLVESVVNEGTCVRVRVPTNTEMPHEGAPGR